MVNWMPLHLCFENDAEILVNVQHIQAIDCVKGITHVHIAGMSYPVRENYEEVKERLVGRKL